MASVRINAVALAQFIRGPDGPTARYMLRLSEEVKALAKEQVGYADDLGPEVFLQGRPHLRDTIVKRFVQGAAGIEVWVGSESRIALLHHNGTEPHEIVPARAQVLRFPVKGGGIVFAARVQHPGTKPNPYLTGPLQTVMSRQH